MNLRETTSPSNRSNGIRSKTRDHTVQRGNRTAIRQRQWHIVFILALTLLPLVKAQSDLCREADQLVHQAVDKGSAGDVETAWRYLKRAVELCPDNAAALGNLGFLHAISNQVNCRMCTLRCRKVTSRLVLPACGCQTTADESTHKQRDADGAVGEPWKYPQGRARDDPRRGSPQLEHRLALVSKGTKRGFRIGFAVRVDEKGGSAAD
eukprot:3941715-Rhodomonas_salina.5